MKLRFNIITLVAVLLCSITAQAQERNANRMVFHKGSNILKTYSVDEVDSICFDYVENKEVGIKVKNIDNYTVTVAFTKPDNCQYYLVSAIPANSKEDLTKYVLSNYKAKLTEDKEYTFEGLKSGIEYYIMALPVDKYGLSTILSKVKVTTLSSDYKEQESLFFDVDYWGDAYLNGYQYFVIRMGDCPSVSITKRPTAPLLLCRRWAPTHIILAIHPLICVWSIQKAFCWFILILRAKKNTLIKQ